MPSFLWCDYWGMRGLLLRIHSKTIFILFLKKKTKQCALGLSFLF